MVHYIIDGYNVVKQLQFLTDKKLKDGRDGLVRLLQTERPQGSIKNRVTIVFDGNSESLMPTSIKEKYNIEIIFSDDEIADDKIKRLVKKSANPRNICVVTDDRELRDAVKMYGAKPLHVNEFIKPKEVIKYPGRNEKIIKIEERQKITQELKKIWLQKNGDGSDTLERR